MSAARKKVCAPIDRLFELLVEVKFTADREVLSRMLARRAITPEYLLSCTGSDEVFTLASEIAEDQAAYYENYGRRRRPPEAL